MVLPSRRAGKFPEGGPTRYQAAFETAARSWMALAEQVLWLNQAQIRTAANAPPQHANAQVAALMAPGLGRFDSEPPATSERTTLLKDVREPGALKPEIIRPPSGTEKYRL
jgi:phytoene dehydrogenase-like protein